MDDEAATAVGDVSTSFGDEFAIFREDVLRELAAIRGDITSEFGRKLNFHTTVTVVAFAVLAVVIGAAAVFGGGATPDVIINNAGPTPVATAIAELLPTNSRPTGRA